jgi:tetratricopeptide (TPR) repeat protein
MCAGRREEALELTQQALQLDPLSASLHFRRAVLEDHCGFPHEAVDRFEDAIEADPDFSLNYFHQAMTLTALGEHEAAMRKIEIAMDKTGGSPMILAVRGHILARMGRETEAQAVLSQISHLAGERLASPLLAALVHCGRGDMEAAAEAVRIAVRQGSYCLVPYLTCSMMAPLRAWSGWPALRDLTNLTGFRVEPQVANHAVELLRVG